MQLDDQTELDLLERTKEEKVLRCAFCDAAITKDSHRVERGGSWRHMFTNPAGYIYEIGCYRSASGCEIFGDYSKEFTWFKGYLWCYAVCGSCYRHLGWHFSADENPEFFGLILKHLV
jgi:hypothetical protein